MRTAKLYSTHYIITLPFFEYIIVEYMICFALLWSFGLCWCEVLLSWLCFDLDSWFTYGFCKNYYHIHIYIVLYIHIYLYIHIFLHIYIYLHICIITYIFVYISIYIYISDICVLILLFFLGRSNVGKYFLVPWFAFGQCGFAKILRFFLFHHYTTTRVSMEVSN